MRGGRVFGRPLSRRDLNGVDDVLVAGTAAEIRRDGLANLRLVRFRILAKKRGDGHQHARRAEAALQPMRISKGSLERVQRPVRRGKTLDCLNLVTVRLRRQHDAGARRLAVEQNRARTADPMLAADVRTGQPEILTKEITQ